jgi:hypothetical protein
MIPAPRISSFYELQHPYRELFAILMSDAYYKVLGIRSCGACSPAALAQKCAEANRSVISLKDPYANVMSDIGFTDWAEGELRSNCGGVEFPGKEDRGSTKRARRK